MKLEKKVKKLWIPSYTVQKVSEKVTVLSCQEERKEQKQQRDLSKNTSATSKASVFGLKVGGVVL